MPTTRDMRPALKALVDEAEAIPKVGFGKLPDGKIDVQIILKVDPEAVDRYQDRVLGRQPTAA